jgi:hypothetical protein
MKLSLLAQKLSPRLWVNPTDISAISLELNGYVLVLRNGITIPLTTEDAEKLFAELRGLMDEIDARKPAAPSEAA